MDGMGWDGWITGCGDVIAAAAVATVTGPVKAPHVALQQLGFLTEEIVLVIAEWLL